MLSPLPRRSVWAYCFAHFTQPYQPSPKGTSGRPAHCPFRGLLGVHSRSGRPPRRGPNSGPANQRLQPLRCLHDCSGCFRLERLPGGSRTHWKTPPFHGAHPTETLAAPYASPAADGNVPNYRANSISTEHAESNMIGRMVGAAVACIWASATPGAAEPVRGAHNQTLPPLMMVQDGKSVGLGIDVLRAAAGRAGIELAFVPLTI